MKQTKLYEAQNLAAAEAILARPERHEGLALEWARLFMSKQKKGAAVNVSKPAARFSATP